MARPRTKRKRGVSRKAVDEGYLKDIYRLFIYPMLRHKPEYFTYKQWINYVFSADSRDIITYQAGVDFEMPGLLFLSGGVSIQGIGDRYVPKDTKLWVRHDTNNEDRYDIEFHKKGTKLQVFKLTDFEWLRIKNKLQPWP